MAEDRQISLYIRPPRKGGLANKIRVFFEMFDRFLRARENPQFVKRGFS
jgi:hypothetical protein